MNSDTDNEKPEDVAFSEARTSAVQRTQAESKKAREIKEKRKAVITKKQAWFRESKVRNVGHHFKRRFQAGLLP
jgi:hypothetical protein